MALWTPAFLFLAAGLSVSQADGGRRRFDDLPDDVPPRFYGAPLDLGLVEPRPVREDLTFARAAGGPALSGGRAVKDPTLSAKLLAFRLDLADASNFDEPPYGDRKFYRFLLMNGTVVGKELFRQEAAKGGIFCELYVYQPRHLMGTETAIEVPSQDIARVYAGSAGCRFCDGPRDDWELRRFDYWSQNIDIRSAWEKLENRTYLGFFACAKPRAGGPAAAGELTIGDIQRGLSLMRQPILVFYSDFPAFQAPR